MKKANCYKELPEGYVAVKTIDAIKDKRFAVLINIVSVPLMLVAAAVVHFCKAWLTGADPLDFSYLLFSEDNIMTSELWLIGFVAAMLLIIVLHELTHGAVYKLFTHEKLTFGLSLSCAYCGVPNLYVSRKTALCSLLAPVTLFSVVLLVVIALTEGLVYFLAVLLFAVHFGSCSGDLYDTFLLLFKYKGDVLINDNGPRQVIYQKQ